MYNIGIDKNEKEKIKILYSLFII